MLRMTEIAEDEQLTLRAMADDYWREIMPQSPIALDRVRRERYFETRFARRTGRDYQWWEKDEEITVGFANAALLTDEAGDIYGYLKDFYITPEHRHRGYGGAFARLIFDWLKTHGAGRVSLHTRLDSPAATAFWQRMGCERRMYIMRKLLD